MRRYIFLILLPLTYGLVNLAKMLPHATEKYYSTTVYPVISKILMTVTGFFPFSLAEISIMLLAVFIIYRIVKILIIVIKHPDKRKQSILSAVHFTVVFSVTIYFLFNALWGLNYYRLDYASITGMKVVKPEVQDLIRLSEMLVKEANYLRGFVREDENGTMILNNGINDAMERAHLGYEAAGRQYPVFNQTAGLPKKVILSELMAYAGIGGVYFPLTSEANVNIAAPDSVIPHTTSHELAHQIGIAKEDEANFAGYISCIKHPDYDFRYSGTFFALRYAMNELASRDHDAWSTLAAQYSPGIIRDIKQLNEYNLKYRSRLRTVSNNINDLYLKSNNQTEGVRSYDLVINLLVAHYLEKQ